MPPERPRSLLLRFGSRAFWLLVPMALLLLAFAGLAAWFITAPRPAFGEADADWLESRGDPAKGRIIFAAGQCASCHASPGQPDRSRLGGGLALESPFGAFRVPNISPDEQDGIGRWRVLDLANALLSGVSPDNQHYYPALPYPYYAHMQASDVQDLMAYLRTLPKVSGRPPGNELPFPFNIRRSNGIWKLLYLDRSPIEPDPTRSEQWNRGRFLVEAAAHCAECHSDHNLFDAVKPDTRFGGGQDQSGSGYVPNISPGRLKNWTEANIVELLTSGATPDGRQVGSTMADVVTNTRSLPLSDRQAIAAYMKSVPARPTSPP